MADKNTLAQMLENLVNGDQAKAEELFHEYVVAQSREIYESLIESEMKDEEDDEEVDEAAKDDEAEDDKVDENFEDIAIEADDEEGNMDAMGGDPTDDLEAELDADNDEDLSDKDPEELFQDLDAIVDELQAKFDAMGGDEGDMAGDEGDMGSDEMKDDFDLETVREYVEKVAPAKMGDNGANAKSIVAGKNDMGGTAANIARGDTANDGEVGKAGGQLKGSSLFKGKPTEDNAGNINVPGGKAGGAFSKKEPGHGAEKKGAGENAENKQSLFRGRR
jgi:hypothetical protein